MDLVGVDLGVVSRACPRRRSNLARRALAALTVGVACAWLASPARADVASWRIAPRPNWVEPVGSGDSPAGADPNTATDSNGQHCLLYDHQVRVTGTQSESFWHWTRRITNEVGLQEGAQVNVDFDPTYQTLLLHSIVVRRGARASNQLEPGAVRLAQREQRLERQTYDGRQSAIVFLNDLRVGDVIDYAYTLRGADPTLAGRYAETLLLGVPFPVDRLTNRLLIPKGRQPTIVLRGPDQANPAFRAVEREVGSVREYRWDLRATKAYTVESDTPSWYDPLPMAQLSEFESWGDVAQWGRELFGGQMPLHGPALEWAQSARAQSSTVPEFILRAARFVQDEVRYLGIEIGMGRRRPSDPTTVFARRYGDCKDKTALLVAVLRTAGIDAGPAFVSTTHGFQLHQLAPSPTLFDHAIVWVRYQGAYYWIDPTAALQGGDFQRLYYSIYDQALVLDSGTKGLEMVPRPPAQQASPTICDHYALPAPGSDREAKLDTERVYTGILADAFRTHLRGQSAEQVTRDIEEVYRVDFPTLRESAPLEQTDDRERNELRVVAHFAIPKFWTWHESAQLYAATLAARSLQWAVYKPSSTKRTAPLAVPFPFRAIHVVHVALPFDLVFNPEMKEFGSSATRVRFASNYERRHLLYTYDIETTALVVLGAPTDAHVQEMSKALETMTQTITYRPALDRMGLSGGDIHWENVAVGVGTLVASLWLAFKAYRLKRSVANTRESAGPAARFGGWLALLGLNVLLQPLLVVLKGKPGWLLLLSSARWRALAIRSVGVHTSLTAPIVALESVVLIVLFGYSLTVLAAFVKKRRSFPWHFTVYMVSSAIFHVLDLLAVSVISARSATGAEQSAMVHVCLGAIVWVWYVHRSERVASTFVNESSELSEERLLAPPP